MALPVTITGFNTTSGAEISQPFISSGGNVYIVGKGSTTTLLRAFKATDPTSSFSNIGTDVTLANAIASVAAIQDGDNIHVVTADGTAGNSVNYRYHVFSMSSDSWTTSNETIILTVDTASAGVTSLKLGIGVRSDGDVIVLYAGTKDAVMGTDRRRVDYARRESGSWTTAIAVDNAGATDWSVHAVVRGSSDRMHLYFMDIGANDAYQRCLTSANALETFPSSYNTGSSVLAAMLGVSYDASGTQKVRCPNGQVVNGAIDGSKFNSADAPTVTSDTDITGTRTVANNAHYISSYAADTTTLWHAFIDSAGDVYTQSNANDGGWDTPTLFYDNASFSQNNVKTNVYTRSSSVVLAMMIYGAGATRYHEYTIRTLGVTADQTKTLDAATNSSTEVDVSVGASETATLGAATNTSEVDVFIVATSSVTLATVTTSTDVDVIVLASSDVTLATVTTDTAATVTEATRNADSSVTLAAATNTTAAVVDVVATSSVTLGAATNTTEVDVFVAADSTVTLATVTTSTDVDVLVVADSSVTLATITTDTNVTVGFVANSSVTLADATNSGAAVVAVAASQSATLETISTTTDADVSVSASQSSTLATVTTSTDVDVVIIASESTTLAAATSTSETDVFVVATSSVTLDTVSTTTDAVVIAGIVANSTVTLEGISQSADASVTGEVEQPQRGGGVPPRKRKPAEQRSPTKELEEAMGATLEDLMHPLADLPVAEKAPPPPEVIKALATALAPRYTFIQQPVRVPYVRRPAKKADDYDDDYIFSLLLSVI